MSSHALVAVPPVATVVGVSGREPVERAAGIELLLILPL
jgi:hypothetical protein